MSQRRRMRRAEHRRSAEDPARLEREKAERIRRAAHRIEAERMRRAATRLPPVLGAEARRNLQMDFATRAQEPITLTGPRALDAGTVQVDGRPIIHLVAPDGSERVHIVQGGEE